MFLKSKIIDGRVLADKLLEKVRERAEYFHSTIGLSPSLAVIIIGEDPASLLYVKLKAKRAAENGLGSYVYHLSINSTEKEILKLIDDLNQRHDIHGILIQLPIPKSLDTYNLTNAVKSYKDVDGFTIHNIGALYANKPLFIPCTPQGVLMLIKNALGKDLSGKKAVVIGRSIIVGKPMAAILLNENCTVTILHSNSKNQAEESSTADILVSAVGIPNFVQSNWIKESACVIDVGITKKDNKIYGDVNLNEVINKAAFITPVPGGVGPMTIACLLANTVKAAYLQNSIEWQDLY